MGNYVTFDSEDLESWDKSMMVCFDELSNFVEQTFFVRLLVFDIIGNFGIIRP